MRDECYNAIMGIIDLAFDQIALKELSGGSLFPGTWNEMKACWVAREATNDAMDEVEVGDYLSGHGTWSGNGRDDAQLQRTFGNLIRDVMIQGRPQAPCAEAMKLEYDIAINIVGESATGTEDIACWLGAAHNLAVLCPRALIEEARQQGSSAHDDIKQTLLRGASIGDDQIVSLIVHKLKLLPTNSATTAESKDSIRGWILCDFPRTTAQSRILEMAITGIDHEAPGVEPKKMDTISWDTVPAPDPSTYSGSSCFDIAFILTSNDDMSLKRALGCFEVGGVKKHIEFTPAVYSTHSATPPPEAWSKPNGWSDPDGVASQIHATRTSMTSLLDRLAIIGHPCVRSVKSGAVGDHEQVLLSGRLAS